VVRYTVGPRSNERPLPSTDQQKASSILMLYLKCIGISVAIWSQCSMPNFHESTSPRSHRNYQSCPGIGSSVGYHGGTGTQGNSSHSCSPRGYSFTNKLQSRYGTATKYFGKKCHEIASQFVRVRVPISLSCPKLHRPLSETALQTGGQAWFCVNRHPAPTQNHNNKIHCSGDSD
jgi:hypothetical protein